jgi:hypothetical protein
MDTNQHELFRLAVLRVLNDNRTRYGLGVTAIGFHLTRFSFGAPNCGGAEKQAGLIADALQYLADKGLIEETVKVVSAANRAWRLTYAGLEFVDTRN